MVELGARAFVYVEPLPGIAKMEGNPWLKGGVFQEVSAKMNIDDLTPIRKKALSL